MQTGPLRLVMLVRLDDVICMIPTEGFETVGCNDTMFGFSEGAKDKDLLPACQALPSTVGLEGHVVVLCAWYNRDGLRLVLKKVRKFRDLSSSTA